MRKTLLIISIITASSSLFAQTKSTTSAIIAFDASTSLDNLPKAENKTVIGEVDTKTGSIGFEAAVKNFSFANPMMQGHFNSEKWLNSTAFPLFSFTGKITDLSKVNFSKNGTYTVPVTGDLTIRDITKPVTTTATLVVDGGTINATSSFSVKLSDYNITGVPVDAGKVSKEPKITVSASLK